MGELLAHLVGDFFLQDHVVANNKAKSTRHCALHVLLYVLPFLFLTRDPLSLAIIGGTHFVIDRFALGKLWPAFWGVGCEGWVCRRIRQWRCERAIAQEEFFRINACLPYVSENHKALIRADYAEPEPAPPFLAVWLGIIDDNILHLLINHLVLLYL